MKKVIFTLYFSFLFSAMVIAGPAISHHSNHNNPSPREVKKIRVEKRAHKIRTRQALKDGKIMRREARVLRRSRKQIKHTIIIESTDFNRR